MILRSQTTTATTKSTTETWTVCLMEPNCLTCPLKTLTMCSRQRTHRHHKATTIHHHLQMMIRSHKKTCRHRKHLVVEALARNHHNNSKPQRQRRKHHHNRAEKGAATTKRPRPKLTVPPPKYSHQHPLAGSANYQPRRPATSNNLAGTSGTR